MTSSITSPPRSPSLLHELYLGRLRWDLLRRFPEQSAAERTTGDRVIAALTALLREHVDPAEVDRERWLPDGLLDRLQQGGFLRLMIGAELGGLNLSWHNAVRVVQAAASWSTAVAFALAINNGFGSGSYLPALPPGPLRDMIARRVADGIVSAGADAEAVGTANARRATVAVPAEDGAAYLLSGEKVYIGNGPAAHLMDVSATLLAPDGTQEVRLFFVDSSAPGFSVTARHEFMGLRGAAIGALRLDRVRVPAEHLLDESGSSWRMRPDEPAGHAPADDEQLADLGELALLGRMLVIAPACLAVAKLCLLYSREFLCRRRIDDRDLGDYQQIQRLVATTAADVFTIDAVTDWVLLSGPDIDRGPELVAAKNIVSLAAWRAVDRTVSLLGAEGYETARSKARRGAQPLPVERLFRDARALRVAGGVDFMLDKWSAESTLSACYYTDPGPAEAAVAITPDDPALSERCREHLRFVAEQSRELAALCRRLTTEAEAGELFERQRVTTAVGAIGGELLAMSVALGRAAQRAGDGHAGELADIACAGARERLAALWPQLAPEPDYATVSAAWLCSDNLDHLLADIIADVPSAVPATDGADHA